MHKSNWVKITFNSIGPNIRKLYILPQKEVNFGYTGC